MAANSAEATEFQGFDYAWAHESARPSVGSLLVEEKGDANGVEQHLNYSRGKSVREIGLRSGE